MAKSQFCHLKFVSKIHCNFADLSQNKVYYTKSSDLVTFVYKLFPCLIKINYTHLRFIRCNCTMIY